jgi:hypothetical protein
MKITSVKDELEICGDYVVIRRRGAANAMALGINGERSIAIATITSIQLKTAGWLPGYILFSYAGSKPFRGGIVEATQDPDAFIFEKAKNDEVTEFKRKLEGIMLALRSQVSEQSSNSLSAELLKLAGMKDQGILSEAEFEAAKKKLLS